MWKAKLCLGIMGLAPTVPEEIKLFSDAGFDGFFTLEADRFLGFSPSVTLAQKKASLIYLYETGKAMLTRWNLWEE